MDAERIEQLRRYVTVDLDEVELDELLDAYQQRDAIKEELEESHEHEKNAAAQHLVLMDERNALQAALRDLVEACEALSRLDDLLRRP
jgi:hypothetical protein